MSLKKVVGFLKRKNNFLITSHMNLEGDALGAELAFLWLVRSLGKQGVIVNDDLLPYGYDFLPGVEEIRRPKASQQERFDSFAILDCSDLKRCGEVAHLLVDRHIPILNIDHHISNENFGEVNWVEERASSCSEMIYKLYKAMRIPLNKEIATALYVGILTDTGSFRYSNTSSYSHQAAAELVSHGLNIPQIYKNIYGSIPYADALLFTKILPTLKRCCAGKIAWFQIKRSQLGKRKIVFDLSEHILTFARGIKDVEVVLLFKENLGTSNQVRVNFRSQGEVNVNKIARFFGGGGHKTASGATINGTLESVRRRVLAKVKESL